MILPIILYGNNLLRKKCKEIKYSYPNLKNLISNMFETMYQAEGIGLAAPQLGLNIRIFILDISSYINKEKNNITFIKKKKFKKVLINPKIIKIYGKIWNFEEGCLSIPGIKENISRPESIYIKYYDEYWIKHEENLTGFYARVIQHEYDHLNGKLFIDYLSFLQRQLINKKLKKISKGMLIPNYKIKISKKK